VSGSTLQHVRTTLFPNFSEIFHPESLHGGTTFQVHPLFQDNYLRILFPFLGIMVPKWQNVTKGEYALREAAAYIAFCKRQDYKSLFTKKLRQHKYASTLVGTAGQKNGKYEIYVVEAILDAVSSDPSTVNAGQHLYDKINARLQKRQKRLRMLNVKFESDITAQNLKMGLVKHECRTAVGDGVLSGRQDSATSSKPVPPFPFRKEDLLTSDEDRQRLSNIWDWTKSLKASRMAPSELHCDIVARSSLTPRYY
jgi:hypothetical protein